MVLKIDGVDFTPYIAYQGLKWQRQDMDGENTGRSLDNGLLFRDRIATKVRLDVTCKLLTTAQVSRVLQAIQPEFVTVQYTDPQEGSVVTKRMYSNNIPVSYCLKKPNGEELWTGLEFPLIER